MDAAMNPGLLYYLVGATVIFFAAFLGGATGFGNSLVSTPLLLLAHFDLPFVVTVNLMLGLLTRFSLAYRFRADIAPRRSGMLVVGSLPGLYVGVRVLATAAPGPIKTTAGIAVMAMAILLLRSATAGAPKPRPIPGGSLLAGFVGGFLGTTTSLNGMPPALLLTRDRIAPRTFIADLAIYFVLSNAFALALLTATQALHTDALWGAMLWLPGALLGNHLGSSLGPKLPERAFRRLALTIVFVAGAVTALTG